MVVALKRLGALAIGLVLALVVGEVGFRLAGIRPPQPDATDEGKYHHRESKYGWYHDREWQVEKPDGVHRVIALGDSFTMGRRVPLDELFVKRVERSLNERSAGARRYEIYNLARSGWNTASELKALKRVGLQYHPDAVVVVFFINDATALDRLPEIAQRMHDRIYVRQGWLNEVSRVYDYLDYLARKEEVSRATLADYKASFLDDGSRFSPWRECKRALAEIRELSRQHGFALGLVIFPMLVQLDEDHELAEVYGQVAEYCASLGVPTLDLLPAFLGRDPLELWVSPTDAHPNSLAHGLAAGPIEEFLVREGLVPAPEGR